MKSEEKKKLIDYATESEESPEEADEEPSEEDKASEKDKASAWLHGQVEAQKSAQEMGLGFKESTPRLGTRTPRKIDPERIKKRIIDEINDMSNQEQALTDEAQRQSEELDEGIQKITDFNDFLNQFKRQLEEIVKQGKLEKEDFDKLLKGRNFQKMEKTLIRLVKKCEATETKRRKILEKLDRETDRLIAENEAIVAKNKRLNEEAEKQRKETDEFNKKILAENERIKKENEKALKYNEQIYKENANPSYRVV